MHLPLYARLLLVSHLLPLTTALQDCKVDATAIISTQPTCQKDEYRQSVELQRLTNRLDRYQGKWDNRHPRYRLLDALYGFISHHELVSNEVTRWRTLYKSVPRAQKKKLEQAVKYTQKLNANEHILENNKQLHGKIVDHALDFYGIERAELEKHIKEAKRGGRAPEKISVGQALKHFVRDWTSEGDAKRLDAFPCVLNMLLSVAGSNRTVPAKVLLPGSGLGRLGHDIYTLGGFEVTLNEYSIYMNVAYRYLESLTVANSAALHPFVDSWSNHASTSDMQRRVAFPDHPASRSVVLVEGDFTTVFKGQDGTFDYIVTLFFIDTARNLLLYFDTIHKLLKPGGVWINFGPLLYGSGPFLQLNLDEIMVVIEEWGFEFLDGDDSCGPVTLAGRKARGRTASYDFNARSLGINAYKAQSWVVRKAAQP